MQVPTSKHWVALLVCLASVLLLGVAELSAQQKMRIAGKVQESSISDARLFVDDTEGHVLYQGPSKGMNVSTGPDKFMDGARWVAWGQGETHKGNGTDWGYGKFVLGGDEVFMKWEDRHTITTTARSGFDITGVTFEGTWTFTKGTGQFENIQGSGTFKGKMISETLMEWKWKGEYWLEK